MKSLLRVTLLLAALSVGCRKNATDDEPKIDWPPLTEFTFTTGRPATKDDVEAGNAAFAVTPHGAATQPAGKPLELKIPQYAIHIDKQKNSRTPCVIIQAEEADGRRIVGARELPGREVLVALYEEFEFLGDKPD